MDPLRPPADPCSGRSDVLPLSAPFVLEYPYNRSLGPVIGHFFTALRDGRLEGVRTASGRVLMPPTEYDPDTGDAVQDFVPVSDTGRLVAWAWEPIPKPFHLLGQPFAWALIRLDGADTELLHVLEVPSASSLRAGLRVRARWQPPEQRGQGLKDIACFELESP